MTHSEIREKFLKFFEERGHKIVPSSSLLPTDPSVLFTTAGMQQFKPYYTGQGDALTDFGSLSTASIQKSIRTSCIDEVGDDTHLTFFEMLGNFSFGGYWKKEAIQWAYEFITKEMGLKIDYISVFGGEGKVLGDKESEQIWKSIDSSLEVKKFGLEDNFWGPTGNDGPCGPSTEVYVNSVEIWNIVFNEFYYPGSREELLLGISSKKLEKLKTSGIDTGMGLERLAMVVQSKNNIFETDLFEPLIALIRNKIPNPLSGEESYRIIADHLRASVLLISEGLRPGKKDKEYMLRKLIRRATMHAISTPRNISNMQELEKVLMVKNINSAGFIEILRDVYDYLERIYPELKDKKNDTETVLYEEVQTFSLRIREGEEHYFKSGKKISGKEAFLLQQSFGFPIELIRELAKRDGKEIDEAEFSKEALGHQEISRAGAEKKFGGHGLLMDTGELKAGNEEELKKATRLHTATHLLHASLRKILGTEVKQAGSDITAERLRFDFTFPRKVTSKEIKQVEDLVNEVTRQDLVITKKEMSYEDAIKSGAIAFFKLKYPPRVNVYSVGDFSKELCGGPHVSHSAEIGKFKIIKEEAVSAGVRRIRATVERLTNQY